MSTIVRPASTVATRAVQRFRGYLAMLADMRVSAERVERIRETTDEYEIDPDEGMCRRGCGNPAAYNQECFACLSDRRLS